MKKWTGFTYCGAKLFNSLPVTKAVASGGLGGLKPPVFGRSVNPISTRGTHYPRPVLLTPRIFRPCEGPVPIDIREIQDINTFQTLTKGWIWKEIPSY